MNNGLILSYTKSRGIQNSIKLYKIIIRNYKYNFTSI